MGTGPFNSNPFKYKSIWAEPWNSRPFSATPFNNTPFNNIPFNNTPFNNTPFISEPFNTKVLTPQYKKNEYVKLNRLNLPDKTARYYLNKHNSYQQYLKNKNNKTESSLSNYNDPKEINSIRDIILGTFNSNMKHSKMFGDVIDDIPILRIIPDSLQHAWDHYWKPQLHGDFKTAALNLVMEVGEDLDTLANPFKAMIMAAYEGNSLADAFVRATFGDENGIKNFDYDTGNTLLDILLEVVSDPVNLALAIFSGGTSVAGKAGLSTLIDTSGDALTSAAKVAVKEGAEEFTSEVAQEVTEKAIKKTSISRLSKISDTYKNIANAKNKETRRELLKKLVRGNTWEDVQEAYNKNFLQTYSKQLAKQGYVASDKFYDVILETVDDLVGGAYKSMTATMLPTLYNVTNFVDDAFTGTVLKAGLTIPGVYPLYKTIKSDPVQNMLHNTTLKKVQQITGVRNLTNGEHFVKAGSKKGVIQTIESEMSVNALYQDMIKSQGPQEALAWLAPKLVEDSTNIRKILGDMNISPELKTRRIINALKKYDSTIEINSMDDFITFLKNLDTNFKTLDGVPLNHTGLGDYIKEFSELNKALKTMQDLPIKVKIKQGMKTSIDTVTGVKYLQELGIFDNYSVKQLLKSINYNELQNLVQQIPYAKLNYIANEYTRYIAGALTETQATKLYTLIQQTFGEILEHLKMIATLTENSNIEYIVKNMDRILQKAGEGDPSVVNNLNNLLKRFTAIELQKPTKLDLILTPKIHNRIFYKIDEVLGTQNTVLNEDLIRAIKSMEDFVPSDEMKFADTKLAKWVKRTDARYNHIADDIDKAQNYIKSFSDDLSHNLYNKASMERVNALGKASYNSIKAKVEYQYDMPSTKKMIKQLIKDNPVLDVTNSINRYFSELLVVMDTHGIHLSEFIEKNLEDMRIALNSYKKLLHGILQTNDENVFKAHYYSLYKIHQDIMYAYKEIRHTFDRANPLDPEVNMLYNNRLTGTLDNLVDGLAQMDWGLLERKQIIMDTETDLLYLQLEGASKQRALNNNLALKELMQNKDIMALIDHIDNRKHPSVRQYYERYSEETIQGLTILAQGIQGIKNTNMFDKNIDNLIKSTPASQLPKYEIIDTAIKSTLYNYHTKRADFINADNLIKDFAYRVQGYINGSDPVFKKQDIDHLLKECNISEQDIFDELTKAKLSDKAYRHSAIYDAVAQLKVWETKEHDKFTGMMLDIETTGLVDNNGIASGNITEIAIVRRNKDQNIEIVFNGKIQLPEEEVKLEYNRLPSVLEKLGLTEEQHIKYLTSTTERVDEKTLLTQFYELLQNLPYKQQLMTFNGEDFDWIFLDSKLTHHHIPEQLIKSDKARRLTGWTFKQETLRTTRSLPEVLNDLIVTDYFKEISKDRFQLSSEFLLRFKYIVNAHLDNQRLLNKFTEITGRHPRFYTGVDGNLMDSLLSLIKLDELGKLNIDSEILLKNEELADYIADVFDNTDLDKHLLIRDLMKKTKQEGNLFKDAIDPEIRDILWKVYNSIVDDISDIGYTNAAWRDLPIPSYLFDDMHPKYNVDNLMLIQNQIADTLPAGSELEKLLRTTPLQNLSQLATIGLGDNITVSYGKIKGSSLKSLDTSELVIDSNNMRDLVKRFPDAIEKVYENTKNLRILKTHEQEIYNLLSDLKASRIIPEAIVARTDSSNLQFTYATLEVLYHKLLYQASMGIENRYSVEKLLKEMRRKYPEVTEIVEHRIPSSKISINTNRAKLQAPSYMKIGNREDYHKLEGLNNIQETILEKLNVQKKNAEYPLEAMNKVHTAGTEYQKLYEMKKASYKNGEKTALTIKYDQAGKDANRLMYAWELNQFMNLDDISIRNKVVNANNHHTIVIPKPSNKYFNNRNQFDIFTTRASELKKQGVILKYDQEAERLTLSMSKDVQIKINKNYGSKYRYVINGEEIPTVQLPEIDRQTFMSFVSGPEAYKNQLYKLREKLVYMNPELSGRAGIVNYAEQYKTVRNDPLIPAFNLKKLDNGDDYMPYFNEDVIGEIESVMEVIGPFNTDYYETLVTLCNKQLNHSHQYFEYGQFLMQGGVKLHSEVLSNFSNEELIDMLKQHQELAVVYLADNPKAVGGFELRKLNSYTELSISEAKKLNATIVPWEYYAQGMRAINNYTYGNKWIANWHKLIGLYKRSWLINPGVFIRNAIDSTMKNFAEGNSVTGTIKSYTQAFDLLNQYDRTMREIRKLDPLGKLRLENLDNYFNKPNTYLDKKTFHFIYDFMENSGMNTTNVMIDGMFGAAMKPNSWIERVSRFSNYLNLEGQGLEYSEIIRRISQTHFNYDIQTKADFFAKHYIPFATYTFNNILYVLHLVEENPSLLRNYFNVYTPIWDFDELNYEELSENTSLQYQILNGNIPLNIFGYKDKEITEQIETQYGTQTLTRTNTAVLKMGSSILDGLSFFVTPFYNIKEKLAPPVQLMTDSMLEFSKTALGNTSAFKWLDYNETDSNYQRSFGSTSIQSLFKDPTNIYNLIPGANIFTQRYMHKENGQYVLGSSTGARTQNELLGMFPSIFGATSRWGKFNKTSITSKAPPRTNKGYTKRTYTKSYYPKSFKAFKPAKTGPGQGVTYRSYPGGRFSAYYTGTISRAYTSGKTPYSKYQAFIYNVSHPNRSHNRASAFRSSNMQSVPQYLYSYMGKNRQGKSKLLSWMRMPTRYKVKTMLRKYSSP